MPLLRLIAEFSVDCNHTGLELPVLEDLDLLHTDYFRNNTHSSEEITFKSMGLDVPIYSTTVSMAGNPKNFLFFFGKV